MAHDRRKTGSSHTYLGIIFFENAENMNDRANYNDNMNDRGQANRTNSLPIRLHTTPENFESPLTEFLSYR